MTTVPLAEARAQLSRPVDEAVRTHHRVEITRNGIRAAVIMSADDDSLTETVDILADAELVAELVEARTEERSGRVHSPDEVRRQMEVSGGLRR